MSAIDNLIFKMVSDIAIDLSQLFDKSFETKSFDGNPWKTRQNPKAKGSLLVQTGQLRRSLRNTISKTGNGYTITFISNLPYAKIHNEGGKIQVTAKMKKFFWSMYAKNAKRIKKRRDGKPTASTNQFSVEAQYWKALALKKVGSFIIIPQRQFIGNGNETKRRIERMTRLYMNHLNDIITKMLNKNENRTI